jgi:hypothetical protein
MYAKLWIRGGLYLHARIPEKELMCLALYHEYY